MRKLFIHLLIILGTFGLFIHPAEAKRFGGGKSFGYQRSFANPQHASRNVTPPNNASNAGRNKWLAPLAGLAAGGLLASLFMGHGLGSGILSWLMVLAGAFFIWRLISRFKSNPRPFQMQREFQTEPAINQPTSQLYDTSYIPKASPSNFDENAFLRSAKTIFIRLQNAYDHRNLSDIREFTGPEVYAEIQMQLQERGENSNQTDVLQIDATLLDLQIESDKMVASVAFTGLIREDQSANPLSINEVWHFEQLKSQDNWRVSGIQQH